MALRFTLIAIPTLILVPRSKVPTRWLIGTGLAMGVLYGSRSPRTRTVPPSVVEPGPDARDRLMAR